MINVIMDCDTGGDDAAAITLAAASSRIRLLGVTTVLGNLPLELTYRNTRELIAWLGIDTPVLKGSDAPLMRQRWVGSERDGHLPFPGGPAGLAPEREEDAVTWMAGTLRESDGPVTLIPLAPLTNIAKLMLFYPDLVREKVERIVLMGGGKDFGNTTGAAELNIYADPEAAQAVFSFGKPVIMCGLDVCYKAYIREEENRELFSSIDNRAGSFFSAINARCFDFIRGLDDSEVANEGCRKRPGAIVYDTVPVIYLLHPELFETVDAAIRVECSGSEHCDGMTVCDTRAWGCTEPKIHQVVTGVDRRGYLEACREALLESEV